MSSDAPDRPGQPGDVRTTEELTEAAAAGLPWIASTRIVVEVLLLVSLVVLARLIPPAAFGTFAIVMIALELALVTPMEGIGSALVQRRSVERRHLQTGMSLALAGGLSFGTLAWILAAVLVEPLYGAETADLVRLATPCFLLGAINAVPVAVLRRRLDFARIGIIEVTSTFVRIVVTIALALAGGDASALVLGYLVSMVVGVGMSLCFARAPLPRWDRGAARDLFPYTGPATLASIAWAGFRSGDYAIINARLGPEQAGFYWRGYQLAVEYQRKISIVMSQMAFPVLARTAGEAELLALRRRMVGVLTAILFPLLVLLVLLAPVVVPWLFGPAWEPAVLPTQILAIGGAATLVIDGVGPALMAAGRSRAMLGYGVAHFVVYAGAVLAVASQGLAAVATAAAVVHFAFLGIAYQVLLGGRGARALAALWADVSAAGVSCSAMLAVGWPVSAAVGGGGFGALERIAVVSAIAGAAYLVTLRTRFPRVWADLRATMLRVVPTRARGWTRRSGALVLVVLGRRPSVPAQPEVGAGASRWSNERRPANHPETPA